MSKRTLYIAAYDIANASRLRKVLTIIKGSTTGGQKSVYECFLDKTEKALFLKEIHHEIDEDEDRFLLIPLDPRSKVRIMGIAVKPADPSYFYIG